MMLILILLLILLGGEQDGKGQGDGGEHTATFGSLPEQDMLHPSTCFPSHLLTGFDAATEQVAIAIILVAAAAAAAAVVAVVILGRPFHVDTIIARSLQRRRRRGGRKGENT
jgi:hypothetical protein